jgi:hypothetical protein
MTSVHCVTYYRKVRNCPDQRLCTRLNYRRQTKIASCKGLCGKYVLVSTVNFTKCKPFCRFCIFTHVIGPKHEIFEHMVFTQIRPVRVGDLGSIGRKINGLGLIF